MKLKKNKMYRLVTSLLLVFCLFISSITPVYATENDNQLAEEFAMGKVIEISKLMPDEGWTENTIILDNIITYDLDGNVNGYIFNLQTDNIESGDIQIFESGGNYHLISYSFRGRHYVDKIINEYQKSRNNSSDYSKIIYAGNNEFLILEDLTSKKNYYNLTTQTFSNNKEQLEDVYNNIKKNIINNEPSTVDYESRGIKRYVTGATYADLVEMDDFSGKTFNGQIVDNHCAPTAGLNLIKYWANRRGVSKLWATSDWWVFTSLCINMKTKFPDGNNSGTYPSDFLSGLRNYSVNTRGVSWTSYDWIGVGGYGNCTFEKAMSIINSEVPFKLGIEDHAEVCFGYYTVNGAKQLIINTGWDKDWRFINFDSINPINYQYVRWD